MSSLAYRPEVDGLRALAIIPVILFHLGAHWLPGGFAGVDVFFVISGYLITSIILKEQAAGTFTLRGFWARRVRRIFPVLVTALLATTAVGYLVGYRNETGALGFQALSALFSYANIYMWREAGDYWGAGAENSPFLHCWSLSVEEQFYLFIPILFMILHRFHTRWKTWALAGIILSSLLLFAYAAPRYPSAAFYLLPTRAWELGLGCLLALATRQRWSWHAQVPSDIRDAFGWIGLALIAGSYFLLPAGTVSLGLIAPTLGAFLFIGYATADRAAGRLIAHPILVGIGKISYSLYVWHWPVIVLARQIDPLATESLPKAAALGLLSCALAAASYFLVETPLRKSTATLRLSAVGLAACVALNFAVIRTDKISHYDTSAFEPLEFNVHRYDNMPSIPASRDKEKKMAGVIAAMRDPADEGSYAREGILRRHGAATPQVVVLGDSHATMWAQTIDDVCADLNLTVSFWSAAGVSPFIKLPLSKTATGIKGFSAEQKLLFDQRRLETIADWRPTVVILSVRWSSLRDIREAVPLIEYIGQQNSKIILIEQPPEVAIGDRNAAQYLTFRGLGEDPAAIQTFEQANERRVALGREAAAELAHRYPFVKVISVADLYETEPGRALVAENKNLIYYDDDHLSDYGARKAAARIKQALTENL